MRQIVMSLMVATATTLAAQQQPTTIRTGTAGVLVDVTVVDKDGHPVTDLTASDFEVSEDGKAQQIISATLMRNGVPARIAAGASPRGSSSQPATSGPPSTSAAPPPIPTVTAILFDSLSADARPFAVKAAAQFVSSMALPTEYGGVFQSGLSLNTVQPFTNRTADLRAAIDRVAITPTSNLSVDEERKRASLRTQGLDPATPVTGGAEYGQGWTTVAEREQRLYGGEGDPSESLLTQMALRMEDGYKHFLSEYEGDGALSGLRSAVTAMAPLPGRKSILYFTEELPITSRLKSKFDALIGEANRANISVYTVDAAGLRVHSKEQEVGQGVKLSGDQGLGDARRSDGGWTKDLEQQEQNLTSRPAAVLSRLANETGGFMIDNTNDLGKGVARMQVDRTIYYLLGYQPTNAAMDGKFRKVGVKVKRGKYTVRARPGYVAPSR
jgi:VWFA-related protein